MNEQDKDLKQDIWNDISKDKGNIKKILNFVGIGFLIICIGVSFGISAYIIKQYFLD